MKICANKKCKQTNPQLIENFNKNKRSKDSLNPICKSCVAIQNFKYYEKNREKRLKYHKEYAQTPIGRDSGKNSRKKYSKTDKGKLAQNRYSESVGGKIARSQRHKGHRQTLKGKSNHCAVQVQRRAFKLQATPCWLTKEQSKQIQTFYVEAAKLTKEKGINYHVDHILPLQGVNICGLHVSWNLQVLTESENSQKNNSFDYTYENNSWRTK